MPIHLFVNDVMVAVLDNLTKRRRSAPWLPIETVFRLKNKEYVLPPDAIIQEQPELNRIKVSFQIEMEKAFDYIASGDLPACVGEAFKAEPTYPNNGNGQITVKDLQQAFSSMQGSLVNFDPPPPIIISAKQAIALGFMTQEEYDRQPVGFPRLNPIPETNEVDTLTSPKIYGVEILNDGTGASIEDTYGFGLLTEGQAIEAAKNIKIEQGLSFPRESVTEDKTLELAAKFEESIRAQIYEQEMTLAVALLDVTLDPVEAREV